MLSRILPIALTLVTLTGCNSASSVMNMFGGEEEVKLEGERLSVLSQSSKLSVSDSHNEIVVRLPESLENAAWNLQRVLQIPHPALNKDITDLDTIDAGEEAIEGYRLTSTPIIADGKVFILDGAGDVTARSILNLDEVLWTTNLMNSEEIPARGFIGSLGFSNKKDFLGGNIIYADSTIFATTGRGNVLALDIKNGNILWQRSVKLPVKSLPVSHNGRLFFVTSDNRLYALDGKTGRTLWTNSGLKETSSMFGASSPAVYGKSGEDIVIAPYSSGEIRALIAETGRPLWQDLLVSRAGSKRRSGISMNDIDATPVISKGVVYASGYDNIMVAFDLYSGKKKWSEDISSLKTPWVVGNFLYTITMDNELVCIHTPDGRVKWVVQLPADDEPLMSSLLGIGKSSGGKKVSWSEPVLAQERLFIAGSNGIMLLISPFNGNVVDRVAIPDNTYLPPVVAAKKLFLLSNDAKLTVLK